MLLITGFRPFTTGLGLKLDHNPTADIARRVAEGSSSVVAEVLPVSYRRTKESFLGLLSTHQPEHWIGLGYAPHRTTLDIEAIALNLEHAERGDNDGERPWMRPIVEGGPTAYNAKLDLKGTIQRLAERDVSAMASFHAGTFLCNQTFYLGCNACEGKGRLKTATFIHVPPMDCYLALESGLKHFIANFTNPE
jgi:pyroglutamyl-peptidase|tara:strand:+ start:436 stop:1014 length:579 start_codon:yes stop_codon:yes gene_type:complete